MRNALTLIVAMGWAAGLILASWPPDSHHAFAQVVPRLMAGAYEIYDQEIGANKVKPNADLLHLIPAASGTQGRYVWENEHANFRVTQKYEFDCIMKRWTTLVHSSTRFEFTTTDNAGNTHTLFLRRLGPVQNHPRKEPQNFWRDCKDLATRGTGTGNVPERVLIAGLQTQAPGARAVDGELFLTPRKDREGKLIAEDIPLWNCLLQNGLPRIQLAELPDKRPLTRSFTWPDARFRADVRGGYAYEWTLLGSAACGTAEHSGGILPSGPVAPPAIAEKIVLACYIKERGFHECHQW